ncbi:MAG: phosphoglycerate dehydrogenase [Actinobacteria bacterium]|nr:phosphoglycerate dehydrogenase [Actinomycetota bacterium]MCB9389303.1 phosphoglycerate dehydrogenase [Acidimicrobiia bacterium]
MLGRVVLAEELAPSAIETLLANDVEVDDRSGASRGELLDAMAGASGIIIRSATQVDAELLDASPDLVVVGRAGIGVDNIDIARATEQGVMVVNAPQSNIISAAEHTIALLLSLARNIPQACADLKAGQWNRKQWNGVELDGKTLGILGLGRIGTLVAQRASALGLNLVAYDPFVGRDHARRLGAEMADDAADVVAQADFMVIHLPKTPETMGFVNAELLANAKPSLRLVNTARGGIVDEAALFDALSNGSIAGAALDVFSVEPCTESPLFTLPNVIVTPHLGASTAEAQDKAGQTIAEQVVLALQGDFVPFALNIDATEASEEVRRYLGLTERLGRIFANLNDDGINELTVAVEGDLAAYDCKVLTLAALKGVFGAAMGDPVSFVNAPQLAKARGLSVHEGSSEESVDYRTRVVLRGGASRDQHIVAGTLQGEDGHETIVQVDEHSVDARPASHMVVIRNEDQPGMIGMVGTIVGQAGVNIADMDVGTGQPGTAMMMLNISSPLPDDALVALRDAPGVIDARTFSLPIPSMTPDA